MRLTIISDDDRIPISNGPAGDRQDFWLVGGGLQGLYGPTPVREQGTPIPQQDGDYWPSRLTHEGRTVTAKVATYPRSSMSMAVALRRVSALSGKRLTLLVEDEMGRYTMDCWLANDLDSTIIFSRDYTTMTMILYCPDPLKYGPEVSAVAELGLATIENSGNTPVWPRVSAVGSPLRSVRLAWQGHVVMWLGETDAMSMDLADMVPSCGRVSMDDAFRLPPGVNRVRVDTTPGARVTLSLNPGWR